MRSETAIYAFRPLGAPDRGLLVRWLGMPHVAQWWDGDAEAEADAIMDHMTSASVSPFIISINARPAGYLQSYDPHAEADHPYADQPQGTLGIDQFIGEPDLVGLGHGPRLIDSFARRCFESGVPRVIIDPHPDNRRAIRAYEKAGFAAFDRRNTIYGPALMMRRDLEDMTT